MRYALNYDGWTLIYQRVAGSEEQKKKYLPVLGRLEQIGCFCLTEPDVGR